MFSSVMKMSILYAFSNGGKPLWRPVSHREKEDSKTWVRILQSSRVSSDQSPSYIELPSSF